MYPRNPPQPSLSRYRDISKDGGLNVVAFVAMPLASKHAYNNAI